MSDFSELLLSYSPTLYWTLDASTGATDQSTGGHNGSAGGGVSIGGHSATYPPIVGAASNTCTDFDGIGNYIDSTYACFAASSTRTFLAWIYRDDEAAFHAIVGGSGNPSAEWSMENSPLYSRFRSDRGGPPPEGERQWANAAAVTTWTFLALVYDESGNTAEVFSQGTSLGSLAITGNYPGSPGNFQVGASVSGAATQMNGKIGHVAVVESALDETQLTGLYDYAINGAPATAPDVVTGTADNITNTTAMLHGTVDPNDLETTYYFEYGLDTDYGSQVPP